MHEYSSVSLHHFYTGRLFFVMSCLLTIKLFQNGVYFLKRRNLLQCNAQNISEMLLEIQMTV